MENLIYLDCYNSLGLLCLQASVFSKVRLVRGYSSYSHTAQRFLRTPSHTSLRLLANQHYPGGCFLILVSDNTHLEEGFTFHYRNSDSLFRLAAHE